MPRTRSKRYAVQRFDQAGDPRGKGIRKNITVTLFESDKTPGRSYNLMDCFPTQWSAATSIPAPLSRRSPSGCRPAATG